MPFRILRYRINTRRPPKDDKEGVALGIQMNYQATILQNAEGEGPGILADCLNQRGWHHRIIHLYKEEHVPQEWIQDSSLVVMGGPMNVYEGKTYPFLSEETILLKKAFTEDIPALGFCLGVQLMAKAMNAMVFKGPHKEIGWDSVRLTKIERSDPLLKAFPEHINVFQWHRDTFELSKGAVRLFKSDNCLNQAMRMGDLWYGFQFHFEITKEMIKDWIQTGQAEIDEMGEKGVGNRILKETENYIPYAHRLGKSFFNGYLCKIGNRGKIRSK